MPAPLVKCVAGRFDCANPYHRFGTETAVSGAGVAADGVVKAINADSHS